MKSNFRLLTASQPNVIIFGCSLLAVALVLIPLQRFVNLSRSQHYGLAIALLGAGYLLQAALSWKKFGKWERLSYLCTGLFFESVGVVFMENPWLDSKSTVSTAEQQGMRTSLIACYLFFGFLMCCVWIRLLYENMRSNSSKKKPSEAERLQK